MGIREIVSDDFINSGIPAVASAATISPANSRIRLTGNTTVDTINLPNSDAYFQGPLRVFNTDAAVGAWSAAGNIALAGTFTRYKVISSMYDPTASKWYPNVIA